MNNQNIGKKTAQGLLFKILERSGVQIVSLIVSIVLARLLQPSDYGTIAMVTIVIEIVNVFVNYGLSSALIQNKNANQEEMSTCFWGSLGFGFLLYLVVFALSRPMSLFFEMAELTIIIRVMGIQIPFTMIHSVQVAIISKRFLYRKLSVVTLLACVVSGILGIGMADGGFGVWALVAQSMCTLILPTIVLFFVLDWKPDRTFSLTCLKAQIAYAWRLLIVGMVDCLYAEVRNLVIAKVYTSNDLAFYNKGAQFPKIISNTVNQSVISVLFPSFSLIQDDRKKALEYLRKAVRIITFILPPVLGGLAAVSRELVSVLLTEKWLPCVPYMQILCLAYIITPIQSVYKQMLKAINKTKMFLYSNIVEKVVGITLLIVAVPLGIEAICWSFALYHVVGIVTYMVATKVSIDYSFIHQIKDIIPGIVSTVLMVIIVSILGLHLESWGIQSELLRLITKTCIGIACYSIVAFIIPNEPVKLLKYRR